MSALQLPQPPVPGLVLGIIARDGDKATVQCTSCYETHTDRLLFAVQWAPFPRGHQVYDARGKWTPTERLCPKCREACGCLSCREAIL